MHIICEQSYNILKEANENIKMIINKAEEHSTSKEEDMANKTPEDSSMKYTRSNMRKKDVLEPDKDLSDMKEVIGRLSELKISVMKILREIT